jgi:hypothetical protein
MAAAAVAAATSAAEAAAVISAAEAAAVAAEAVSLLAVAAAVISGAAAAGAEASSLEAASVAEAAEAARRPAGYGRRRLAGSIAARLGRHLPERSLLLSRGSNPDGTQKLPRKATGKSPAHERNLTRADETVALCQGSFMPRLARAKARSRLLGRARAARCCTSSRNSSAPKSSSRSESQPPRGNEGLTNRPRHHRSSPGTGDPRPLGDFPQLLPPKRTLSEAHS